MKSKLSPSTQLKEQIIVNVLDYIDNNNDHTKHLAIDKLRELAKLYGGLDLRVRSFDPDNKLYLREFILNNKGYIKTIPDLFNSLHNSKRK